MCEAIVQCLVRGETVMMKTNWRVSISTILCVWFWGLQSGICDEEFAASLPTGVQAVWSLDGAGREATATRERICINGLWRWQPAARRTEVAYRSLGVLQSAGLLAGHHGLHAEGLPDGLSASELE